MSKDNVKTTGNVNPDVLDFGVSIGSNVERRLGFKPRATLANLCQGWLTGVVLEKHTAPTTVEKTGLASTWEYAGLDIPNLVLSFMEAPIAGDPAPRFYDHRFQPYTVVKKDGSKVDRKTILDFWKEEYTKLRHITNAFTGHANYAEVAIPPFNPFLEDPIKRLEEITAWYAAWELMFKGKDGKGFAGQLNNIKLVASYEGTYLAFPSYTGQGFFEKAVNGVKSVLELKASETIELIVKKGKGAKTSNATPGAADDGNGLSPELQAAMDAYKSQA